MSTYLGFAEQEKNPKIGTRFQKVHFYGYRSDVFGIQLL